MQAAIYSQGSTSNGGQSPEMQLRELRDYRGWQVTGEYVDNGVSGDKERRPELDRGLGVAAIFVGTRLRSTMQFQRTANSALTLCLTSGDHRILFRWARPPRIPIEFSTSFKATRQEQII